MSRTIDLKFISFFVGVACCVLPAMATVGTWAMQKSIPISGAGGWDYISVDQSNQRLFVTHGDHVVVIDLKTQQIVGTMDSRRAHGVAFAPELNRGFISNGGNATVTIFNLATLVAEQSVKVGENPDAICYDPVTKRVFAFNGGSGTVSVIDATTEKLIADTALPGKPEFAQSNGKGIIFDNIEDKDLVIKIDAATLKIVAQWSLPPQAGPSALALDTVNQRLFVGCRDKLLYVLDSQSGKILSKLPIGEGVDAVEYDGVGKRVFASCGAGTLSIIDQKSADNYSLEMQFLTRHGARTMSFDSARQTAYLPIADFGSPPLPTPGNLHPRPAILPGTLRLLVVHGP